MIFLMPFGPKTMAVQAFPTLLGKTAIGEFLVDLIDKGITGKQADAALDSANITVNKNAVPNDPQSPFVTSGIRVGTPAITTRGCGVAEVQELAGWMCDVMDDVENGETIVSVRNKVLDLCKRFPVYASS